MRQAGFWNDRHGSKQDLSPDRMKLDNLIPCPKCHHMVSKDAIGCPKCGSKPTWDEEVECMICQKVALMSQCDQLPNGFYHKSCLSALFSIPRGLRCKDCGSILDPIYNGDLAFRIPSKPCPNCGSPNTLQRLTFECPWCGLPVFDAFQSNKSIRIFGESLGPFHTVCARKQKRTRWLNWFQYIDVMYTG